MTISQLREYIQVTLSQAGIREYQSECRLILEHIGISNTQAMIYGDKEVGDMECRAVDITVERATTRRPIQYILGEAWFYGRPFYVDSRCLIPRFDTEVLCREAIEAVAPMDTPRVADLCTGSGCIAITLSLEAGIPVVATDISREALDVARINVDRLEANVELRQGDMFDALPQDEKFDLILCNPPYIAYDEGENLEPEVTKFEPSGALFAEDQGLLFYRRIAREAGDHLSSGGYLLVEIGDTQGAQVKELFERAGYDHVEVIKDYGNMDRVVKAHKI